MGKSYKRPGGNRKKEVIMPSKKAAQIKFKIVIIKRDCKYSSGDKIKTFKVGDKLFIHPKFKNGFEIDKPFISEKFRQTLEFNKHI